MNSLWRAERKTSGHHGRRASRLTFLQQVEVVPDLDRLVTVVQQQFECLP